MEPIEKDDHFIPDGMNAFERNVKRIGDCILALGALIVFSPFFTMPAGRCSSDAPIRRCRQRRTLPTPCPCEGFSPPAPPDS